MKTEDIKIWQHRLPSKQPHEPALWREESKARQEETNELRVALKEWDVEIAKLRAALAGRDAEIEKLKAKLAALDEATMSKLCMQRTVMQQALYQLEADHYVLRNSLKIADAIAALKEALK